MRIALRIAVLALAGAPAAWSQEEPVNVNSRYTVESVEVTGEKEGRLTRGLREDLRRRVGEKFNQEEFEQLARRVRRELRARRVVVKVLRGDQTEHVKVVLEVVYRTLALDAAQSKLIYHSRQGWSVDVTAAGGGFTFGILSDQDELLERFAGLRAGLDRSLFTRRIRAGFLFETFHQQWHPNTLAALESRPDLPGIYRTRYNFQPRVAVIPVRPLTLRIGLDFERLQTQFPVARREGAHAAAGEIRFRDRWRDSRSNRHGLDAGYSVRIATRALDSDFVYGRHAFDGRYTFTAGRESLIASASLGRLNGRAPLYERFTLGDSTTLRGWSKFDVFPLGGTRQAHGGLEYRHRVGETWLGVFYDSGAVWERGDARVARHSVGLGLFDDGQRSGTFATVAFPVKSGRALPIFTIGTRF